MPTVRHWTDQALDMNRYNALLLILFASGGAGCDALIGKPSCSDEIPRSEWTDCLGEYSEEREKSDGSGKFILHFSGLFNSGLRSGFGTETITEGSEVKATYEGDFLNDKRNGNGTYTLTGVKKDTGTFLDGIFIEGKRTLETGHVEVGKFSAEGLLREGSITRTDGVVTEGIFVGRVLSFGTVSKPNGSSFSGTFDADGYQLKGKQTAPDGETLEGTWRKGGGSFSDGVWRTSDGVESSGRFDEEGRFREGKRVAADGTILEGTFSIYDRLEEGSMINPDGTQVRGKWDGNGNFLSGSVSFGNGDILKGTFSNNAISLGTYLYVNGDSYEGPIRDFVPHGRGKVTFADGTVETGEFRFGKRRGWDMSPADQMFLANLVRSTKSSIRRSDNDALEKQKWINAARSLCASTEFNAFGEKSLWVGYVRDVDMDDDGDVYVAITINSLGNSVRNVRALPQSLFEVALRLNEGTLLSRGSLVRFSGFFQKGNADQNECLDATRWTSTPEFNNEEFSFRYTHIELVD